MQQHSGFENRFIDAYHYCDGIASENAEGQSFYASVFKPDDSISLVAFPGVKTVPFSPANQGGNMLSPAGFTLPVALLVAAILFVFLKNTLKSSVGSIFLIGLFPKSVQESDRRQIERNMLIVNLINAVSFFSLALVLYAVVLRFDYSFPFLETFNIPEGFAHLALFFCVVGFVLAFFYARSGFISLLGNIFSVSKMIKEYQKPYKMLFLSLSPILLSVAAFITFAPYFLMNLTLLYLLGCIATCYVTYITILLLKISNFTTRYSIHIFLYLCTLEILPLVVIVKFLQGVYF